MKHIVFFLITACLITTAFGQVDNRMIDEIRKHNDGTALWWAGHNSWIIKSGDLVVSTDSAFAYYA
jgi:hypothetical protein